MSAARVPRRILNIAPAKPLLSGLLAPLAALGILLLGPLDAAGQQPPPLGPQTIEFAFPDLSFSRMTHLTHAGDGTDRLWVVLQRGLIEVFPNDPEVAQAGTFLDIRDQVRTVGDEEGLLGLAFDPGYADNGYFYVYYSASNPRRSVISRFSVSQSDPDQADPASELVLLEVAQPFSNHNGGNIVFGPDGYMYVGLGDGGSGGDPLGNGQDTSTLLGTVLRIDVRGATETTPYRVPPDNPLVDTAGARDEIWAHGLRNPWEFSFDPATDALWLADVGQDRYEEIHLVQPGQNYGWNVMEGRALLLAKDGVRPDGLGVTRLRVRPRRGMLHHWWVRVPRCAAAQPGWRLPLRRLLLRLHLGPPPRWGGGHRPGPASGLGPPDTLLWRRRGGRGLHSGLRWSHLSFRGRRGGSTDAHRHFDGHSGLQRHTHGHAHRHRCPNYHADCSHRGGHSGFRRGQPSAVLAGGGRGAWGWWVHVHPEPGLAAPSSRTPWDPDLSAVGRAGLLVPEDCVPPV